MVEVLRSVFESSHDTNIGCMTDLITQLSVYSSRSKTTKLWIENLIKLVIIMMTCPRDAHESDMALHLAAAEAILPFFLLQDVITTRGMGHSKSNI